jgi:hypothetical protein
MLSIRILESDRQIAALVNRGLASAFNQTIRQNVPALRTRVRSIIAGALYNSHEIASLSGGTLMADFGLTSDPSQSIVSSIVSSMNITTRPTTSSSSTIRGGFTLTMQPSDYSNILSLPVSQQVIDGGSIPWLEWLLTLGDAVIIANFGVEYGPFGRTGRAHMLESAKPFKVNSSFSGTPNNNFVTRAIQTVSQQIETAIIGVLQ